jgi:hypothetical protein
MADKHSNSRAHSVMGGTHKSKSKSKSGKKPHSMHIRRGKSGGFIVQHHHEPDDAGMTPPPDDHVVPDMASLQSHIADNMGDQGAAPAPAPPPDASMQPAPPASAGAPPPAAAPAPPAGM